MLKGICLEQSILKSRKFQDKDELLKNMEANIVSAENSVENYKPQYENTTHYKAQKGDWLPRCGASICDPEL